MTGSDSVVVVDGSAGVISEGDTTVLSSGQVVMGGGGSTLDVVGRNTGAQAQFSTPGTQAYWLTVVALCHGASGTPV